MKKVIHELKRQQDEVQNNKQRSESNKDIIINGNDFNSEPLETMLKSNIGNSIKSFLQKLEDEIKKFYKFYAQLERNIYIMLNKHLYNETHYLDFYINSVIEECNNLENLINDILNFSHFINLNLLAIRKILKKFDKSFKLKNNPIAFHYLGKKLSDSSSNLVYILQFKIIDESSALIEKLVLKLEKVYNDKSKLIVCKADIEKLLKEPLLKELHLSMLSGVAKENIENIVTLKLVKLKKLIEEIDDSNNIIRSSAEFWKLDTFKSTHTYISGSDYKQGMIDYIEEENILENLTPQVHLNVNSKINLVNVWLSLIHTFLYTMNAFIVQPTNAQYLSHLNASPFLTGLVLSMTPFAAILSTFFYSQLVNTGYKFPYFISCGCFVVGNLFYSLADYKKSVILMAVGRIFVGLGGARVVNRRYLLEQVPDRLILHYSLLYVIMISLGMAAGPGIALILYSIPDYNIDKLYFNTYTNPGWFCLIIWMFFSFFFFSMYDDHTISLAKRKDEADIIHQTMSPRNLTVHSEINSKHINSLKKMNINFDDCNLVSKDVEHLIQKEENTFSYLNKIYLILSLILFTARVNNIF